MTGRVMLNLKNMLHSQVIDNGGGADKAFKWIGTNIKVPVASSRRTVTDGKGILIRRLKES
jgi:hypothetical protein